MYESGASIRLHFLYILCLLLIFKPNLQVTRQSSGIYANPIDGHTKPIDEHTKNKNNITNNIKNLKFT